MKKQLMLVAVAALAACDTPMAPALDPQFSAGGGNPQFSTEATDCVTTGARVDCVFKVTGLGKNVESHVTLTVDARETFQCANPQGMIVHGQGERVRVGSGAGLYRSEKSGRLDSEISATVTWAQGSGSRPCPTGHSVVESSVATQMLWELRAEGGNKGGWWSIVYAPVP